MNVSSAKLSASGEKGGPVYFLLPGVSLGLNSVPGTLEVVNKCLLNE